jgi:hypothetical protein
MTAFFPSGLRRVLIVAAIPLALAACSVFSKKKEPPPCPEVNILAETAKFTRFRPGRGRDVTDVALQGEITGYNGSCKYDKDSKTLTVTLQVSMTFTHGPAATSNNAHIDYYVAVPAYFPKPEAKQVLGVQFAFAPPADHVQITDYEVEVKLPVADFVKDMPNRDLYIGFQLSPDELDYNRREKK